MSICHLGGGILDTNEPTFLSVQPRNSTSHGCELKLHPPEDHFIEIKIQQGYDYHLELKFCQLVDVAYLYILQRFATGLDSDYHLDVAACFQLWQDVNQHSVLESRAEVQVKFPELHRTDTYDLILEVTGILHNKVRSDAF